MALSGANKDGTSNIWGDTMSNVVPSVLGAISLYYTGSYKLGSTVGNLANKGLDSWTNKLLGGTDAAAVNKNQAAKDDQTRAIIDRVGGAAASIYSMAGGADGGKLGNENGQAFRDGSVLGKMFNDGESRRLLRGASSGAISDYLGEEGLLGAGQAAFDSKNSSITGMIGDGIFSLDGKAKQKGLASTLPNNLFANSSQLFAGGGEPTAAWRDFVAGNVGWNEQKTGFLRNIDIPEERKMIPDATRVASTGKAPIASNENSAAAYQYLTQKKGLSATVAAAFLGNLIQESGLNPSQVHDNGTGYGIAGWRDPTPGNGRKTALFNYMKMRGKPVNDLYGQLDFLVDEANQRKDIQRASQYATPEEASNALSQYYFRPLKSAANNSGRAANASNIFNQNKTMATRKFSKGGVSLPYLFFEGGGESGPADVFGDAEIRAIRDHYQLDDNETVNNLNFNLIVEAGLHGLLPISPDSFKGSAREGLLDKINSKATYSGTGYGSGDAKVVRNTRVGGFFNSLPSVNPEGFTTVKTKGTMIDPSVGTKVTFPKKNSPKSKMPYVFFQSGGESYKTGRNGKK